MVIPISSVVPALYTAVAAFTEPGDRVILQRPVYGPFTDAVTQQGREVSNNALLLQQGRYEVDFEDLERRAADPRAKLMLLCSPHNPVGKVFTRQELEKIGEICRRHQVLLFADEIHGDFVYPGSCHIPAASVIPVSYTHLDVYKRQTGDFASAYRQIQAGCQAFLQFLEDRHEF